MFDLFSRRSVGIRKIEKYYGEVNMIQQKWVDTGEHVEVADGSTTNALTVDVEDYFHVSAMSKSISRDRWSTMEYRAEASTDRLLTLFDEFGVCATFFVLGWITKRSPHLVRKIYEAGHEIACHGLNHELVYRQTPREFADETRYAKSLLENIIGAPVDGYRAASWSITRRSLWALDVICDLGFKYDSSIFPIHHDRYGIPGAPQWPGLIRAPNGESIVEFPPSTLSFMGGRIPVAGGGYFRLIPYELTKLALRRINRLYVQPFIFYLHPWEIDPDQPRIDASYLSQFRHYNNLRKTEARLRNLLSDFRFTTARNVLKKKGLLDS